MSRYSVIDVSKHNGVIDWDTTKENVDGVIIRVGHGNDSTSQDDQQAIRNMEECERLGIPYGVYLYSYALNNAEAESEAAHALRMVEGYNPVLGVWFDMEDADGYKEKHGFNPYDNRQEITDFCKIFCDRVSEAGYKTGVYASKNY
jgi:GH25 family lysozyme M1 (1,4-beta-N-acetylmuramidase)